MHFIQRVPKEGDRRSKWISMIEKYQTFDYNRRAFNVCKRHFSEDDFLKQGNQTTLVFDAVPSVFEHSAIIGDRIENQIIGDGIIEDAIRSSNRCHQCPFLKDKVAGLKHQISILTIQHDITVQTLQQKIILLENRNEQKRDQINKVRKELSQEKNINVRLRDVVAELKNQNFISAEDEKILNV